MPSRPLLSDPSLPLFPPQLSLLLACVAFFTVLQTTGTLSLLYGIIKYTLLSTALVVGILDCTPLLDWWIDGRKRLEREKRERQREDIDTEEEAERVEKEGGSQETKTDGAFRQRQRLDLQAFVDQRRVREAHQKQKEDEERNSRLRQREEEQQQKKQKLRKEQRKQQEEKVKKESKKQVADELQSLKTEKKSDQESRGAASSKKSPSKSPKRVTFQDCKDPAPASLTEITGTAVQRKLGTDC